MNEIHKTDFREDFRTFREIRPIKVFKQVIEQTREITQNGELGCGDQLPSERDLREQLNVSRTSVREALRSLKMLSIIECRQGEGNFIKESFEDSLLEPISIAFVLHGSRTSEILELRKIIEPETAASATKDISDAKLQETRELMSLLNHEDDSVESAEIDRKIHYKIVQASGNDLITNVMYAISNLIDRYIEDMVSNLFQSPESRSIVKKQHEAVVKAIGAHDASKAAAAIREYLDYTSDFINSLIIKKQGD